MKGGGGDAVEAKEVGDPEGMLGTLAESKLTSLDGPCRDAVSG